MVRMVMNTAKSLMMARTFQRRNPKVSANRSTVAVTFISCMMETGIDRFFYSIVLYVTFNSEYPCLLIHTKQL